MATVLVISYSDYFEVIVTLDPITEYPPTPKTHSVAGWLWTECGLWSAVACELLYVCV